MRIASSLVLVCAAVCAAQRDETLAKLLERRLPDPELAWVLADARSGAILASRWDRMDDPVPVGSLVKPFAAIAWARTHDFHYPVLTCRGCWLPRGHGAIGIRDAVANSCNSYFLGLASDTTAPALFGLILPASASPSDRIGEGSAARFTPAAVIHAYAELFTRAGEPGVAPVLDGMREAARRGTARALGDALAKTGTAPCAHSARAPGDGFVVASWPAAEPRYLLLLRRHGAPGSNAAASAAEALRALR